MKTSRMVVLVLSLALGILGTQAQTALTATSQRSPRNSIIPVFTNNPVALFVISNLLAEPSPELTVPDVSPFAGRTAGTYWTLTGAPVPLPFNPFADLPTYEVSTNHDFIIDDRSVDYVALDAWQQLENEALGLTNPPITVSLIDKNGLWLQVPGNSLATPGGFSVNVMNSIQGQSYDILTTPDLTGSWAAELVVTGAVGNITPVTLPTNGRTNLFVRARTSALFSFYLVSPPLSQYVVVGDTVTFRVETGGNTNLTYQWTFNGEPIDGATNNSYTINPARNADMGYYAVIVSDGINSMVTGAAQLVTDSISDLAPFQTWDYNLIPIWSDRQDYVFRSGITYYISQPIQLFGNTTIEGGAVIKMDWYVNASLDVKGTLTCKTTPYFPATLTSVDDDFIGESLGYSELDGPPQPVANGAAYLDLTDATSNSISNLRFKYADWGVTTPARSGRLEVWDCQFVQCNYGVINLVDGGSTNSLHNVLFAGCGAAVGAATNSITIEAEQVTADVADFCAAGTTPNRIAITNSIVWGNPPAALNLSSVNVVLNPNNTNFVSADAGLYYLVPGSQLHQAGTANISARLQNEFREKSTFPPLILASYLKIAGTLTLSQQAPRYTNGAPDLGYYYDVLDYTVGPSALMGGSVTVLPGTALGFRNYSLGNNNWTDWGFWLREGSAFIGHGTPDRPIIFADEQLVQEQTAAPCCAAFVPDFLPQQTAIPAPVLDLRFCRFFTAWSWFYHVQAGYNDIGAYEPTPDSLVNWTMQDCALHGGRICLGPPDDGQFGSTRDFVYGTGAVTWRNNSFENVNITLSPTYYWYNQVTNCDMRVQATHNLFRGGLWFYLSPYPTTAGNWVFTDNVFDKSVLLQDTGEPLDFDHNAYWSLSNLELAVDGLFNPWYSWGYGQLRPASGGNQSGAHDLVLSNAPPYQAGPFGDFYLPVTTQLYGAGSQTPADAGLSQYTTRMDQFKEGDEPPTHLVNIGVHYVAATNSPASLGAFQSKDSDGDGIPDYFEVEHGTDPNNPMTDGMTNDTYNAAYDDVDLSGDGLVGRVKSALGLSPTNSANPLALTKVFTGKEPDTIAFELPISYTALTNVGEVHLTLNGVPAEIDNIVAAADGNTLLYWASAYNAPSQYLVQAKIEINVTGDETAILTGVGTLMSFTYSNDLQFFSSDSYFDANGAYLDAQLPEQNASYIIQLYDPTTTPETFIRGITNTTANGMIQEDWDLTYDDRTTVFNGSSVDAFFTVTSPQAADPKKHERIMPKLNITEQGNGFDFTYMYTPATGAMYHEFDNDFGSDDGIVWMSMQSIVDDLIMPQTVGNGGNANHYDSGFNNYTSEGNNTHGNGTSEGFPGFLDSMFTITNSSNGLFPDMRNGNTKSFYCSAHGNNGTLSCYAPDKQTPSVEITSKQIGSILGNSIDWSGPIGVLKIHNPYRFVFLDGCATASGYNWRTAFGIYKFPVTNSPAREKIGPQAFVGWGAECTDYLGMKGNSVIDEDIAAAYTETLYEFYDEWMQGKKTLAECLADASVQIPGNGSAAFPVTGNERTAISGLGVDGYQYSVLYTNVTTSPIYVIGHSGLLRNGSDPTQDNVPPYIAPSATQ